MNIKDIMLGGLAKTDEDGYPYKVNIHCVVTDELQMPDSVRNQFPEHVMFVLSNEMGQNLYYDYEKRTLAFVAAFGGNKSTIVIPADSILMLTTEQGEAVSFGVLRDQNDTVTQDIQPQQEQTEKPDVVKQRPKALYTLKHLSLVVDNT